MKNLNPSECDSLHTTNCSVPEWIQQRVVSWAPNVAKDKPGSYCHTGLAAAPLCLGEHWCLLDLSVPLPQSRKIHMVASIKAFTFTFFCSFNIQFLIFICFNILMCLFFLMFFKYYLVIWNWILLMFVSKCINYCVKPATGLFSLNLLIALQDSLYFFKIFNCNSRLLPLRKYLI